MKKQRIVVKIGSSSLTNDRGEIDQLKFNDHISALAALRQAGHEVIVVSSGQWRQGLQGWVIHRDQSHKRQASCGGSRSELAHPIIY